MLVLRNNLSNRFVTRWHHKTRHISFFCRNILYRKKNCIEIKRVFWKAWRVPSFQIGDTRRHGALARRFHLIPSSQYRLWFIRFVCSLKDIKWMTINRARSLSNRSAAVAERSSSKPASQWRIILLVSTQRLKDWKTERLKKENEIMR